MRTRVFYCDTGASNQKGAVEREHVELRRIPPNEVTLTRKLLEVELPE